jgi:hypothetical protein
MAHSTYSKKKSFHVWEGTMNFFENWKVKNGRNCSKFRKTVFYKHILDFHFPSKIFMSHIEIIYGNFVKITGP